MASDNMVVDTNIFIEYLRSKDKRTTTLFSMSDEANISISAVTLYELHMGAANEDKKRDVELLTEDLTILPLNEDVARQAALIYHLLRSTNQLIEFRDIFIAATCIAYDHPLKTLNVKHFKRIQGLKLS